jgi:hypothetical protein
MAGFAGQGGDPSHEGAADAQDMNMHEQIVGGRFVGWVPPLGPWRAGAGGQAGTIGL